MLNPPLRLAVLCSKRAPGLEGLLHDPSFRVDMVMTTESDFADCGIPVTVRPIRDFYRGVPIRNREFRRRYDAGTAALLKSIGTDYVIALGYLYVLTEPMLSAFPDRIINLHDADLILRKPDGSPRYPGLHATRDAIMAGEPETRSCAHIVTADLDGGPVVARSDAFTIPPVARAAVRDGRIDVVRRYAYAQREWMMTTAWPALVVDALQTVASHKVVA